MLTLITPCLASEPAHSAVPDIQIGQRIGDGVVTSVREHTLSTEEVISYYVNEKGYSLQAATNLALELALANTAITTRVVTVNVTDGIGLETLIELGCRVKEIHGGSGKTNFSEIIDSWTGIVSSGIQEWNEYTHSAEIIGATKTSIEFYARGVVEILVSASIGANVDLLETFGFTVSGTVGGQYIIRKVADLEGIYTLPGYPDP